MTTPYTSFNETVLRRDALAALKNGLIPLKAFSTGIDMTGKLYGDVVLVPIAGAATATTRTLGSTGTAAGSASTASVTLTTPITAQWACIDGKDPKWMFMQLAIENAYAVAKGYIDAALAYITSTNYGNDDEDKVVCPVSEFGLDTIAALGSRAETKKLGRVRSLILNGAYAWQALGEGQLAVILATMGSNALQTGTLPPLGGMASYMYAGLPANSENLGGFVCSPDCLACGMAPVMSNAEQGTGDLEFEQVLADEEAGVVMSYRRWYNADAGIMSGRFEVMPGFAKCNDAVVRLVSA